MQIVIFVSNYRLVDPTVCVFVCVRACTLECGELVIQSVCPLTLGATAWPFC